MILTEEQVKQAFVNAHLKEKYEFDADDLVDLANAFVKAAQPEIRKQTVKECVKVAKAYNPLVAAKIEEVLR